MRSAVWIACLHQAMQQRERLAKKRNEAFMKKKQREALGTDAEASEGEGKADDLLGEADGDDAESAEEEAASSLDVDEGEAAKQASAPGVPFSRSFHQSALDHDLYENDIRSWLAISSFLQNK